MKILKSLTCLFLGHKGQFGEPEVKPLAGGRVDVHSMRWRCSECGKERIERWAVSEDGQVYDLSEAPAP
jgi:hypothetical protein